MSRQTRSVEREFDRTHAPSLEDYEGCRADKYAERHHRDGTFPVFPRCKLGDGNEIMSHTNKFVIRTYHRIPVRCVAYYLGGDFLGKGTVMNLCRNGFRVLGDHQVVPGMDLVVRLTLPDKDEPVEIQRVVVRWVRGLLFGAKVVTMSPEGEDRVGTFLSSRLRAYCASS